MAPHHCLQRRQSSISLHVNNACSQHLLRGIVVPLWPFVNACKTMLHTPAPIDFNIHFSNKSGFLLLTGQIATGIRNFRRRRWPSKRHSRDKSRPVLRSIRLAKRQMRHACAANDGENSIEIYLMWSIFNGQRLVHRDNGSLGRIVPRQLGKGPYASRGGSLDEAAWAVLLQKQVLQLAFVTSASTKRPLTNAEAVDFPNLL